MEYTKVPTQDFVLKTRQFFHDHKPANSVVTLRWISVGSSGPKQHRLYRLFWKLLKDLGVWGDEEYLQRKEGRTVRDDRREIIPACIITVSDITNSSYVKRRTFRCVVWVKSNSVFL